MSFSQVLSSVVHGNSNFCCLCFQKENEDLICLSDEVYIDSKNTQMISELINIVFGEDVLNTVSAFGVFCEQCMASLVNSYKFKKTCKENLQNLMSIVDSITESFENVLPLTGPECYSTLYVSVDPQNFTSKQFYDDRNLKGARQSFKRFSSVVSCTVESKEIQQSYKNLRNLLQSEFKAAKTEKSFLKTDGFKFIKKRKQPLVYDIPLIPTSSIVDDSNTANYSCKVCCKQFIEESKLRSHFFKLHYPRNVKCPNCSLSFISKQQLEQHEEQKHTPGVCSHCGKHFKNDHALLRHEMYHNLRITCHDCSRVYGSMEAFKKHIADDVCRQKTKKSADQANFQCDICNKRYCYKPYLAKHIMYEHGNAEGFRCKFCNKQFYTKSRLETHVLKHTGEKNFLCTICDGKFGTRAALIYHTRLHTGEKPYKCEYCDKAFLSASRRLDHTRRYHLAPSLECDICKAKFKVTGGLLRHKKRHLNPNSKVNNHARSLLRPEHKVDWIKTDS